MLQSLKQLYGYKLQTSDGEIGHLKDFYFDDQNWAVRYVVANTGAWLPSRQVLISPHVFGDLNPADKILRVKLTRKQIEDSPSIETHKPISRQYEEDYYRYYGWPGHWQGSGLWGATDLPIMALPINTPSELTSAAAATARSDSHLRSAQAVTGYHLQANDGIIGHVSDYLMDARSWAISQLIIKIGHRLSGKEVQVPIGHVSRISYEDSTVFVNVTKETVEQHAAHFAATAGGAA